MGGIIEARIRERQYQEQKAAEAREETERLNRQERDATHRQQYANLLPLLNQALSDYAKSVVFHISINDWLLKDVKMSGRFVTRTRRALFGGSVDYFNSEEYACWEIGPNDERRILVLRSDGTIWTLVDGAKFAFYLHYVVDNLASIIDTYSTLQEWAEKTKVDPADRVVIDALIEQADQLVKTTSALEEPPTLSSLNIKPLV